MKVTAIIEQGEDNTFDITLSDDRLGFMLLGQGATVEEAKADFQICNKDMKALYADEGKVYPDLEIIYKYDLVSFLAYYSTTLGYSSLEKITGVNQRQLSQYLQGYRNPSAKTTKKIESGIKAFAEELSQVQFV